MASAGEAAHVRADLSQDGRRRDRLDPRNGLQQNECAVVRQQATFDGGLHLGDRLTQEIDMARDVLDQHEVLRLDAAVQWFAQLW